MAVVLPQLARAHHGAARQRLSRRDGGSTSLPVLPRAADQDPLVIHEVRHVHRHYHVAIGALEPLHEAPNEADDEPPGAGSPKSSSSRATATRKTPPRQQDSDMSTAMNTAEMLLGTELPVEPDAALGDSSGSRASGATEREEPQPRRGPRARRPARRAQSVAAKPGAESETAEMWGRYASSVSSASRPVLGRRPCWSNACVGEDDVERRIREIDAEGQWLQQRVEFRKKMKVLPDSNEKRKLVGDPRLRHAQSSGALEKIRQEDIARCRQSARTIRGAMQDCSKSRQQLKSMQMMLRGVETDELQRQKAAAALLLRGEVLGSEAPGELA